MNPSANEQGGLMVADKIDDLFVEEEGRDAVIHSVNGVVVGYSTNTTEDFVRYLAEKAGLLWNEAPEEE